MRFAYICTVFLLLLGYSNYDNHEQSSDEQPVVQVVQVSYTLLPLQYNRPWC